MDVRVRPPYRSCQSMPISSAWRTIGSSGVIPIPPAMNKYFGAGTSGKLLRGPPIPTMSPSASASWTYADPPRPAGSRSTPTR